MGQFTVMLTVHPRRGKAPRRVRALVDSGAAYSVIPRPMLESWGCRPRRMQRVVLPDGRREDWAVTEVEIECGDRRVTTPVLMGPAKAPPLLGAITLQGLAMAIDPVRHRLVPVDALFV